MSELEGHRRAYPCRVCGAAGATTKVWLDTPLGLSCWWTCAGPCEARAVELEGEQPAKRVPEPLSREEKAEARRAKLEAESAARVELEHEAAAASASPHPADL